ncbi:MAG TPA: response regulator transcription factor [Burkholderiales bacterium]
MAVLRVLLVDDHAVVRAGYRRLLELDAGIAVAAEAADAAQGYAAFCAGRPDVSIVDLSLPGGGGLELIRRIHAHTPQAAVLAFSMHEDALFAVRALQAGARGYVTKKSAPDVLIEAVAAVSAGRTYLSPDVGAQLAQRGADAAHPLERLSARELEIFRQLADGRTIGDIAAALHLSPKTVANYQTQIKEKLGVASSAALVHLALRLGLLQPLPN